MARLESQVIRYKSAAETSEKAEDELKIEKRKLQREVRIRFFGLNLFDNGWDQTWSARKILKRFVRLKNSENIGLTRKKGLKTNIYFYFFRTVNQ